jgi:hypothetical protein
MWIGLAVFVSLPFIGIGAFIRPIWVGLGFAVASGAIWIWGLGLSGFLAGGGGAFAGVLVGWLIRRVRDGRAVAAASSPDAPSEGAP